MSVVLTDTRGVIQFANPRFTALTGYTSEDVLGKTPRVLKSGTMAPDIYEDLWETVLAGREWSGELCNRKKSGELYWESALVCPVFDGQGQATHFLAIKEDITERKRTQEALRESEERFRLITEGTPAAVIMVDDQGMIVHANPQAKGVFGYEPLDLVGRSVQELVPARLRKGHRGFIEGFLRDPSARPMGEGRELAALHQDGRELAVEISLSPVQTGGRTYVLSFITDISVRKQAEAAVRESEERFRQMANDAPVMIWLTDPAGRRTFFNATWLRYTGRELAAELGDGWLEGVHSDSRESLLRAYRAACERGEPVELEYRLRRADGSYGWLAMRAKPRLGHEHAFLGLIGCCTDISQQKMMVEEQRRIEEKLQETAKLESLGVLAGGIAHDFNNILTGILGNVSLAQMDQPANPALRETLAAVYDAAMRASDLCKQMLAYSGRGRFILRRMELGWLVRDTLNLVHAAISKTVRLEIDLAKDLPAVEVDVPQVQQVIMNLVINASEAIGDAPGVIRLTTSLARANLEAYGVEVVAPTRAPSQYVALEVADNGCGISPEGLKRIFDPFYTTKFTGRGLGLAAVQGILRGHRGALYVQSTPGQGTSFTLLLPWVEGLTETTQRPGPLPEASAGHGKILVVDDEEIVRSTAARILQRCGYHPVLAVDGLDGIHQFKAAPGSIRLVLLDLTMPGMDGTRTFAELRAIDPAVRVLLMSGFHENEAIARFSDVAPAGFLQKPIVADELLRAIETILRQAP